MMTLNEDEKVCTYSDGNGNLVEIQPSDKSATYRDQVASQDLLNYLKLDVPSKRPIWSQHVVQELDKLVASGKTISCPHYPHSAEDIRVALNHKDVSGFLANKKAKIGVVRSLSPWVEHVLRSAGARSVTTIDFNPPILCGIDWIESKDFPTFYSEDGKYDLLVSFSGIEHTGLGRYGDPIDPDGDIGATDHMYRALRPGGVLLLGVPTSEISNVEGGNMHRIYGPDRLERLIKKFDFTGRVWNSMVLGGWSDVETVPELFVRGMEKTGVPAGWMHQQVLILKRPVSTNATITPGGDGSSILLNVTILVALVVAVGRFSKSRFGTKGKQRTDSGIKYERVNSLEE